MLTVFNDRAPEVGEVPGPNQPGLVLTGFVERVGDPVPLVASDGSSHRGEVVLVEALDVLARAAGGGSPVTIAVPAHWGPGVVGALRNALRAKPSLSPGGVPADAGPRLGRGARTASGRRRDSPPTASWCCATSAVAEPASRWPMRGAGLAIIGDTVQVPGLLR